MKGTKIIGIAASVFIAVIVIAVFYSSYRQSLSANQATFSDGLNKLTSVDYSSLERYSGKTIYGSEVKYLLNSDAMFEISTEKYASAHSDEEYFNDFSDINNATSITYVDQSALFSVSTIQSENGALLGLRFKEVRM